MSGRRAVFFLLVVTALAFARPAQAHTAIERATPGPGEAADAGVDSVEIVFLDPVLPGVTVEVADLDGRPVAGLSDTDHSADRTTATVTFEPLDAGDYAVRVVFTAEDGDQQEETYRFTVEGAGTTTTAPPAPGIIPDPNSGTPPEDAGDRGGALQIVLFVAVIGGIGLIAFLVWRESRRRRDERGF